ncbi:hypothetical protein ALQ04_05429 [Pseudomonas cichorii]|uniref:Uncharacterized protein n=1 Tax=Pseudomonas cichorii TaxID=36746 RepID=A0A3M4LWH9_PSECI|nr:hypothetical protein ALQ04_05429 [Pseudomonas cichorii]
MLNKYSRHRIRGTLRSQNKQEREIVRKKNHQIAIIRFDGDFKVEVLTETVTVRLYNRTVFQRLNLKLLSDTTQVSRQIREFRSGYSRLVRAFGSLRRQVTNTDQASVHFPCDLSLFFRSGGNHQIALVDLADGFGDDQQGFARAIGQFQRAMRLLTGLLHGRHCLMGTGLDRADHLLDFTGRLLGTMRQRAHFVCHHSKAAPGFACAGGLDGGIECKQVGLLGDGTNDVQYLADIRSHDRQATHFGRSVADLGHHEIDRRHGFINLGAPVQCRLAGLLRRCRSRSGIAGHFIDRSAHFVDGRRSHFDFITLTLSSPGSIFGYNVHFFRSRRQLGRRVEDRGQCRAQVSLHGRQRTDQTRRFVSALLLDGLGQIVGRDALGDSKCLANGDSETTGVQPGKQHSGGSSQHHEHDHHHDSTLISRVSTVASTFGFHVVHTDQLLQIGLCQIGGDLHIRVGGCHRCFQIARSNLRQIAILDGVVIGNGLPELIENLLAFRRDDQLAKGVGIFANCPARLLDITDCLGLAILRLDRVAQARIVTANTDKLTVQRTEQLDAGQHIGFDVLFRLVQDVGLTHEQCSLQQQQQTEEAKAQGRTRGKVQTSHQVGTPQRVIFT